MLRVTLQQARIAFEPVGQALGIIHAVDADSERAPGDAADESRHRLVARGPLGIFGEASGIYANGVDEGAHGMAIQPDVFAVHRRSEKPLGTVAEIAGVLFGLETQHVIGTEIRNDLATGPAIASITDGGTNGMCRKKPSGPWNPFSRNRRANGIK